MIAAPKGLLKLQVLKMLSESSLSGSDLQQQIGKSNEGLWNPGPGSIYFMLAELRRKEMIVELPHRGGTIRRYVISKKGRDELARLSAKAEMEVKRQLGLLAFYARACSNEFLHSRLKELASGLAG